MSLPSCVLVISLNTKKDIIQNIPDSPLLASETLSYAEESYAEDNTETILAQLPPVPSFLPDDTEDGATCTTTVHRGAASSGCSLQSESYTLSAASADLPISRWSPDEEKLLWPLEVCLLHFAIV